MHESYRHTRLARSGLGPAMLCAGLMASAFGLRRRRRREPGEPHWRCRPGRARRAARGAAISVMAQEAPEGPLMVVSDTSGTVNPVTQSKVAAQIAGTVARIQHMAGDWVKAGETVIQLDDTQLKLSVATASSALDNAKIVLSTNEDTTSQASPKLELQVQSAEAALAWPKRTSTRPRPCSRPAAPPRPRSTARRASCRRPRRISPPSRPTSTRTRRRARRAWRC